MSLKLVAIIFELEMEFQKHARPTKYRGVYEDTFQAWLREQSRSGGGSIDTFFYKHVESAGGGLVRAWGLKKAEEIMDLVKIPGSMFSCCLGCERWFMMDHAIPILRSHGLDTAQLERDLESVRGCDLKTEWLLRWVAEHLDQV